MKKCFMKFCDKLGISPMEMILSCVCVLLASGYFGLSYLFIVVFH